MTETLAFLLTIASIVLAPYCWIILLTIRYGRSYHLTKNYTYRPSVTIYLPTYNEEKRIRRKLENLLDQDYPISEILIFDCSTDRTADIIREFQAKHGFIRLIRQAKRIGMAKTFNEAIQEARGEVLIKTDCDSIVLSRNSISELVANFSNQKVGAATGICVANNGIEKYFRSIQTLLQVAETNLDSTIIGHSASLLAFRRSALERVNPDSAAEDTEEVILIRKKGYKTVVDKSVVAIEEVPEGFVARRTQKDRRAHGIIQALIENKEILFNRKYGKFGLIVFPQLLFILIFSPLLFPITLIMAVYLIYVINPYLLLLVLIPTVIGYVVKPHLYIAIIDAHISGLLGTFRVLRGRKDPVWRTIR